MKIFGLKTRWMKIGDSYEKGSGGVCRHVVGVRILHLVSGSVPGFTFFVGREYCRLFRPLQFEFRSFAVFFSLRFQRCFIVHEFGFRIILLAFNKCRCRIVLAA